MATVHRPSRWGDALRFLTVMSVALYLVPEGAHVFAMFTKLRLAPAPYMTVQRIYDGWAMFGILIVVALILTLALAIATWRRPAARWLSLFAFAALLGTQALFWAFIFPMNALTKDWSEMPADLDAVRRQWEYAHAASAILTFAALMAVLAAVLIDIRDRARGTVSDPADGGG